MNYENPSPTPALSGQEVLREKVEAFGFDFYEELPEGWLVVDDMVSLYDLDDSVEGNYEVIEQINLKYDNFTGVMAMTREDGTKLDSLLCIIARDPMLDRDSQSDFADPEHPVGKKVTLAHADGHEVEFTIIEGEGLPSAGTEQHLSNAALDLLVYDEKGQSNA